MERIWIIQEAEKVLGGLIAAFQHLRDRERLFTRTWSDRTRGNGFRLKDNRFRLDIRIFFFFLTLKMMKHWDGLTREVLHAPPLSEFKARLDGALTNQIQ